MAGRHELKLVSMGASFSDAENEWLDRRAAKIAEATGDPLRVCRSAAVAQLLQLRGEPKAKVVPLRRRAGSAALQRKEA